MPVCLLVTNSPELFASLGLPTVPGAFPEGGRLGGMYSGLRAAPGGRGPLVASDMPFLSGPLVADFAGRAADADVIVPEGGGRLQTRHAVYGTACLPAMKRRLRAGQLAVAGLFDDVRLVRVPADVVARFADPDLVFTNLNTPEELARARALWDRRPGGVARGAATGAPGGDGAGC